MEWEGDGVDKEAIVSSRACALRCIYTGTSFFMCAKSLGLIRMSRNLAYRTVNRRLGCYLGKTMGAVTLTRKL